MLTYLIPNMSGFGRPISAVDSSVALLYGRPYGGVGVALAFLQEVKVIKSQRAMYLRWIFDWLVAIKVINIRFWTF